jgi:hypothetical protein
MVNPCPSKARQHSRFPISPDGHAPPFAAIQPPILIAGVDCPLTHSVCLRLARFRYDSLAVSDLGIVLDRLSQTASGRLPMP